MKRNNKEDSLEFDIAFGTTVELDLDTNAYLYVIKTPEDILKDRLYNKLMERLKLTGYNFPKIEHKFLIVFEDLKADNSYVCLHLHHDKLPIFISNNFKYNKETVTEDLHKLFQDWMNVEILNQKFYSTLRKVMKNYKDYTITENDDEIIVTIRK